MIHLTAGMDPERCPTCQQRSLSPAVPGRLTKNYFAHCWTPGCSTTLVMTSPPVEKPLSTYRPPNAPRLPLERNGFTSTATIAKTIDARTRQVGSE